MNRKNLVILAATIILSAAISSAVTYAAVPAGRNEPLPVTDTTVAQTTAIATTDAPPSLSTATTQLPTDAYSDILADWQLVTENNGVQLYVDANSCSIDNDNWYTEFKLCSGDNEATIFGGELYEKYASHTPRIEFTNMTANGEIAVVFPVGWGTGAYFEDIYLYDAVTLQQLHIEKAMDIAYREIGFSSDADNFYIDNQGSKYTVPKSKVASDLGLSLDIIGEQQTIGAICYYKIADGTLYAVIPIDHYHTTQYDGAIIIEYSHGGGGFAYDVTVAADNAYLTGD